MLSFLIVVALRVAPDPAGEFMEESRKAIFALDEGAWRMDVSSSDHALSNLVLRRKEDRTLRASVDGTLMTESAVTGGNLLFVSHADRTYYRAPALPMSAFEKPDADEKVAENEFRFVLSGERGFTFVVRPALAHVEVTKAEGRETLRGDLTHADGEKRGALTYVRDATTKLPIEARLEKPDGAVTFRFRFERRAVKAEEMSIPLDHFLDYRMVDPPKKPSGTL